MVRWLTIRPRRGGGGVDEPGAAVVAGRAGVSVGLEKRDPRPLTKRESGPFGTANLPERNPGSMSRADVPSQYAAALECLN